MTDTKPTTYHQHDISEMVEIDTGWIPAFPIPKEESLPTYRRVLIGMGHEVKEDVEKTEDGFVLRYRPMRGGERSGIQIEASSETAQDLDAG